jgi:hypothetical protein
LQKSQNSWFKILRTLLILFFYLRELKVIQLHDKNFEIFIAEEEINFAIETMAQQIEADFFEDVPIFIGVLNGSFMVVSDLL